MAVNKAGIIECALYNIVSSFLAQTNRTKCRQLLCLTLLFFMFKLVVALFHLAIVTAIMGIFQNCSFGIKYQDFFPHFLLETDADLFFIRF